MFDSLRIALRSKDPELRYWAGVIAAMNLGVIATCLDPTSARETADIRGRIEVVGLDVTDHAAIERLAVQLKDEPIDILINNAGVGGGAPYGFWTDAAWEWRIGVNLMAVVWGIEIFGPLIEQHGEGGHIVSTASVAGLVSYSSAPYNVSKYGVVALSEGLRPELAPRGIGVSVLCPGFVRTNIMDSLRNLPERFPQPSEQMVNAMRSSTPLTMAPPGPAPATQRK